jgi:hypothetical protein
MRYFIELSVLAAETLQRMPQDDRSFVSHELGKLAETPVSLSRPSATPPYPSGYQVYEFFRKGQNRTTGFSVLFKYSQDETRLLVAAIGRWTSAH